VGFLSLIRSAAHALDNHDTRCNALLPGAIKTQLNEQELKDKEKRVCVFGGQFSAGEDERAGGFGGASVVSGSALSGNLVERGCWLMGVCL